MFAIYAKKNVPTMFMTNASRNILGNLYIAVNKLHIYWKRNQLLIEESR